MKPFAFLAFLKWTYLCVVSPWGDHEGCALVISQRGETTHSGVDVNNTHLSMINPLNNGMCFMLLLHLCEGNMLIVSPLIIQSLYIKTWWLEQGLHLIHYAHIEQINYV